MYKNKPTRSIFTIILAAFFVVVIPVYAAGFAIYHWAIGQIRQEMVLSQSTQTNFYMDKFRSDILRIVRQQSNLLNDKDVIKLSAFHDTATDIEMVFAINRVQARLSAVMDSSDIINNVSIHMPAIEKCIYAVGSISDISMEEYGSLRDISSQSASQMLSMESVPLTIVASPNQYGRDTGYPAYLVVVEYSPARISSSLRLMKGESVGGIALIDEQEEKLIAGFGAQSTIWGLLPSEKGTALASAGQNSAGSDPTGQNSAGSDPAVLHPAGREPTEAGAVKTLEKSVENNSYLVTTYRDAFTGWTLMNYMPTKEIYQPLRRYQPYFWGFTLFVVLLAVSFLYFIYRQVKKPLATLVEAFQTVENGGFDVKLPHPENSEFRSLYSSFHSMLDRIRNLIEQVYKQRILQQKSELRQLQSQINPHFLYNSYFILYDMAVNEDIENLADYAKQLGTYYQYITRNSSQVSMLFHEVQHAKIYAEFQAHRFRNRITLYFDDLPEEIHGLTVPKLILQPLIENVFTHGLKNKVSQGVVRVKFYFEDSILQIVVEDNGDELSEERLMELKAKLEAEELEMECTGLINIHRRIRLSFGSASGVFLSRGELGGLKVILHLEDIHDEAD